jgi:hypothetical protein
MGKLVQGKPLLWKVSFPFILFLRNQLNVVLFHFSTGGTAGSESDGMIPRSVRLIFAACEALRAKGWAYKIEASFLEIYNEQIRDLLGPSGGVHDIRIVNNETVVTNLKVS